MNLYYCSDGSRVSEATIKKRYSEAIQRAYVGSPQQVCRGCNQQPACGSAHTIARARLKQIHKTELIWDRRLFWPACHGCNRAIENPAGDEWKELKNISQLLPVIQEHDPDLYRKFMANISEEKFREITSFNNF